MNSVTILGIAAAFHTFMTKTPVGWSVGFGIAAFFFVTVIPVILAVFFATMPGDVTR